MKMEVKMKEEYKMALVYGLLMIILSIISYFQAKNKKKNQVGNLLDKIQFIVYLGTCLTFLLLWLSKQLFIYWGMFVLVTLLVFVLLFGIEMREWKEGGSSNFFSVALSFLAVLGSAVFLSGLW